MSGKVDDGADDSNATEVNAEWLRAAVVGIHCGIPEPNTPAWERLVDDIAKRPNLSPQDDGAFVGHLSGAYLFDDPDGDRAWAALTFAHRRWAEHAVLTGKKEAIAIERLLRFVLLASTTVLPEKERADRINIVAKIASGVVAYLRVWTKPGHETLMHDLIRGAGEYSATAARESRGRDPIAMSSPKELQAYARCTMDLMMFHLRMRFHMPEEFWEAPDLPRLVLARAADALVGWSRSARSFPNCDAYDGATPTPADAARDHLPQVLVGTLSRGVQDQTHKGATVAERRMCAGKVAQAIARELNEKREEFHERLCAAEGSDVLARSTGGRVRYLDEARQWVAFRIAHSALVGLYVAGEMEPKRARITAESRLSNAGKNKK